MTDRWIDALAAAVRADAAKRVDARVAGAAGQIEAHARAYELAPGDERATAAMLDDVTEVGAEILPAQLVSHLRARAWDLRRVTEPAFADPDDADGLESVVRALRTTQAAYADDGRRNAALLAARLASRDMTQDDQDMALLHGCGEEPSVESLRKLGGLQGRLLDDLRARKEPASPMPTHDADARQLLRLSVEAAAASRGRQMGGVGQTLERYADALEADRPRAEATLARYTVVLAATCQQAVAAQMSDYKPGGLQFETVIVDEAARANPLDLMIPLALARRRVVLVGDQAQLPHILEPEVERELDGDVAEQTRERLRESLFARLFENFRAREARGEPARVVTLDTQFRMHPVLGDFVSRSFYEPATVLRSARPASDFPHHLTRFGNAVAAWVELPHSRGPESGRQSKERRVEAEWIAEALPELMEEEPTLSFGVITPYARQRTTVLHALRRVGLAHVSDLGDVQLTPSWAEGIDGAGRPIERLRVGTVDAFQGMEFDVVILSLTRSSPPPSVSNREALRWRYGHLMLANRLCVAMSRQRRLLVVVGDPVMASTAEAKVAVPSLVEFRALCEGAHGAILVG